MPEIKFYKSKWKAIRLILLPLPFIIGGIYLLLKTDANRTMCWLCICFFGLGIPVGLFNLFDTRPELVLDENGIFDRMSYGIFSKQPNRGPVKWDWIKDVYLNYRSVPGSTQKYICIHLNEEGLANLQTQSRLSEQFGMADYNFLLMNLNVDENKLLELIKAMISADKTKKNNILLTAEI